MRHRSRSRPNASVPGKAVSLKAATVTYHTDRLLSKEAATHKLIGDLLRQDIRPLIGVADAAGKAVVGVESHVFQNGGMTIITLLSNPLQRVDELGPPDFRSNKRFEHPVAVTVTLPSAAHVYDVRSGKLLGTEDHFCGQRRSIRTNDSCCLVPTDGTAQAVRARERHPGAPALGMSIAVDGSPADTNVFHVDVLDPSGVRSVQYSTNVLAPSGRGSVQVPFADERCRRAVDCTRSRRHDRSDTNQTGYGQLDASATGYRTPRA